MVKLLEKFNTRSSVDRAVSSYKLCSPLENCGSDAIDKYKPLYCRNVHKGPLYMVQILFIFKGLIEVSLLKSQNSKFFTSINVCTCVHIYANICSCMHACRYMIYVSGPYVYFCEATGDNKISEEI